MALVCTDTPSPGTLELGVGRRKIRMLLKNKRPKRQSGGTQNQMIARLFVQLTEAYKRVTMTIDGDVTEKEQAS